MAKNTHPGCEYTDWHDSDECRFDDLRYLGVASVIVDEYFKRIPIEVKHVVHAYFATDTSPRLLAAAFRLKGGIGRE